jgi:hypothetical protein
MGSCVGHSWRTSYNQKRPTATTYFAALIHWPIIFAHRALLGYGSESLAKRLRIIDHEVTQGDSDRCT